MHPNENPGAVLVTPLLSGNNYHSWSRSMQVALRSKHKLHFINGALPRPFDDDHDSIAWDRCNTMIMSWLINFVEPEISQSILRMESALDIWNKLKERFYQGDIFRISDLQEEIYTLKQGENSISSYYTKMKKLWQELDNFRPSPISTCVENCKAIAKMREYKDSDQVICFLKGLNEQFSAVRSQIMLMDPFLSIGKVYSLLVQQERQGFVPLDKSKLLAISNNSFSGNFSYGRGNMNASRGRGDWGGKTSGGRGKGIRVCSFCGRPNHTVDTCFKKHGFPPHHQQENSINNCTNVSANEKEQNLTNFEDDQNHSSTEKLSFIYEQHKALLPLLQNSSKLHTHSLNHITTNNALTS